MPKAGRILTTRRRAASPRPTVSEWTEQSRMGAGGRFVGWDAAIWRPGQYGVLGSEPFEWSDGDSSLLAGGKWKLEGDPGAEGKDSKQEWRGGVHHSHHRHKSH